jgi:hypothetical protein
MKFLILCSSSNKERVFSDTEISELYRPSNGCAIACYHSIALPRRGHSHRLMLELRLALAVDPLTVTGTIRLLQGRSSVRASSSIAEDGKLVQIATDGLEDGKASFVVDDLRDVDGRRFERPLNKPFPLGAIIGLLPPNTVVEHSVLLARDKSQSCSNRPPVRRHNIANSGSDHQSSGYGD